MPPFALPACDVEKLLTCIAETERCSDCIIGFRSLPRHVKKLAGRVVSGSVVAWLAQLPFRSIAAPFRDNDLCPFVGLRTSCCCSQNIPAP
eukprot:1796307-Amphidinium_carterae.1